MNLNSRKENIIWVLPNQINGVLDFYQSINWKEPWLLGLLLFHCLTLVMLVVFRSNMNIQCVMFVSLLGLAVLSETVNELGAKHWRSFAREQYFDSAGLFIMAVYSGPMLFTCFLIMLSWLWVSFKMMVVVAKGRIKERKQQVANEIDKKTR